MSDKQEQFQVYDLQANLLRTENRKDYYKRVQKEYLETGKVSSQIKRVILFLMTAAGDILLQRRSQIKNVNAGLIDKTIGGHVQAGDSCNSTVFKECAEELGISASVLSLEEYKNAITKVDLRVMALLREVDLVYNHQSVRIMPNGEKFVQPYISAVYIGYYNGPIQFFHGETVGAQYYSLPELKNKIRQNPDEFTADLKEMVNTYSPLLRSVLETLGVESGYIADDTNRTIFNLRE